MNRSGNSVFMNVVLVINFENVSLEGDKLVPLRPFKNVDPLLSALHVIDIFRNNRQLTRANLLTTI